MLKHMLTSALGAGLAAGILAALLHFAFVQDLILTAESYETGEAVHFGGAPAGMAHDHGAAGAEAGHDAAGAHSHDAAEEGDSSLQRNGLTVVFHIVVQVAYGLILVAGFGAARALGRDVSAREGVLWGIAGFAAVQLAPAMGLAPDLPGTPGAEFQARQVWWAMTVLATAGGLALLAFGRNAAIAAGGVALVALPHMIGAPETEGFAGVAPPELAAAFAARVLGVGLVVWATLGWVAGRLWSDTRA